MNKLICNKKGKTPYCNHCNHSKPHEPTDLCDKSTCTVGPSIHDLIKNVECKKVKI